MASRRKSHPAQNPTLQEITQLGLQVFGDPKKFNLWLQTPSHALGGDAPAQLLAHATGRERLATELTFIEHGIFC